MAGYFGTALQQRLQAEAETNAGWIAATPGACQAGRIAGCDDPATFGWQRIDDILDRDGVCGFRLISPAMADELRARLAARNCRFDTWDVFVADRATALGAIQAILSRGLPSGLREMAMPVDPEGDDTLRIQRLMGGAGLVPFSGSLLTAAFGAATTVAVADEAGNVVATAHGYLPHNTHSPYHRYAWGGLVAVEASRRGQGMGNFVNARMIENGFDTLGATHVYELVSATNVTSRRMVEACGLRLDPSFISGIAIRGDSERFTR